MNAAPRSSRVVMKRMDEEAIASITWRFSSPGRPNTYSTPSFSRHETRSCATLRCRSVLTPPAYGHGTAATLAGATTGASLASGDLDHLLAHGVDHRFHARMQVQLLEDVPDVILDGVLGDVELLRDIPVVQALSDELEDLHLALGQARGRHLRPLLGRLRDRRELREELRRHGGRDPRLSGPDAPDRVGDLLDRDLLAQAAAGACLDRVVEIGFLVADREHQDLDVRKQLLDLGGRLDPRTFGHPDVHEDDVGHRLLRLLDRFLSIGRLADELQVGFIAEDHLEP